MITSVIHSQTLQLPDPVIDDTLTGTSGDDVISGGNSNDLIQGKAGDDLLSGGAGDDSILGGSGDDTLSGGSGNDTLVGGAGANDLNGGSGDDLIYASYDIFEDQREIETLDGGSGVDTLSLALLHKGVTFTFGTGQTTNVSNFENLIGTEFADHIEARTQGFVDGGGGDDDLRAFGPEAPSVTLLGGEGNDSLYGARHDDLLEGGNGKDKIVGYRGADTIDGGDGRDRISASADGSVITSGQGADVISLMAAKHHDPAAASLITDLENTDRLDLHRIDADSTTGGDQAFTLVESLSGHAGEAALSYDAGSDQTSLLLDTDGDGAANITVLMTGDHTDFTNFVL